jgi:pimeloyl-ACP methyl ester carboxylesterase
MTSGTSGNARNRAERLDHVSGTRELFEFFGPEPARLAGITYLPAPTVSTGVIVCPSIAADFAASYRWEVNQARHLCANGIAVQRFHYRGMGHSDGEPSDMTYATMCEDAVAAVEHLRQVAPIEVLVVAGTRMGALVAARVASRIDTKLLVLIEPVLDSTRFFRDGFRARLVHEVKEQRQSRARPTKEMLEELNELGVVDTLGHSIHRGLFASISDRHLDAELPADPGQMLLVQFGSADRARPEYQTFITTRIDQGWVCDVVFSPAAEAWWFVQDEDDQGRGSLPAVTDWITATSQRIAN